MPLHAACPYGNRAPRRLLCNYAAFIFVIYRQMNTDLITLKYEEEIGHPSVLPHALPYDIANCLLPPLIKGRARFNSFTVICPILRTFMMMAGRLPAGRLLRTVSLHHSATNHQMAYVPSPGN